MAKMLKHLVFGLKKNPPAPPRPDYEGERMMPSDFDPTVTEAPFFSHDYENIPKAKPKGRSQVQFVEEKETQLLIFDNYSEPADHLRCELSSTLKEDPEDNDDPLYMSPLDDRGTAPPLEEEEEDMYCVPYDTPPKEEPPPPLPQPCRGSEAVRDESGPGDGIQTDATYDVVPDLNSDDDDDEKVVDDGDVLPRPAETTHADEYDEPWEWTVGARLTSSLQVSPAQSLDEDRILRSDPEDEDEDKMTSSTRRQQQRRLLYETAFDSRVKRDADDLDRLMQSPLFSNRTSANESVARAASRSSFGSTSGSSASSTPTHQPMEIARQSPRLRLSPTERRKVTLVRDGRSMSPRTRPDSGIRNQIVNQNFERRISFSNSSQWDSISRCSGSSDRSSSQESMNVESSSSHVNSSRCMLGRSASRDSLNVFREDRRSNLVTSNYPNNWKELSSAKLENAEKFRKADKDDQPTKKAVSGHTGIKVLPNDTSNPCLFNQAASSDDLELKENNTPPPTNAVGKKSSRSSSLLSEVKPMDNLPQSPENDLRSSEDYDPPWDINSKVLRPKGSMSVPEKLSSNSAAQPQLPTSVTHDKLEAVEEGKDKSLTGGKPCRPTGLPSRPSLNLNLNSDSPNRKARQNLMLNFGCSALSTVGEKVDPQLTLEKQGWYHGSISRVDAEGKLRVLKEGSYLVRNSESSKQDYSLSLRSARGFMHMKIVPTSEGRFILGQFSNPFSSIPEMIQHYSVNKLPIKGAEHMSLLYPVIDQLL